MAKCDAERIAEALLAQLVVQELPEDYDPGDLSYNEVLAYIRHEYTNYQSLLWEMQETVDCCGCAENPCSCDPEEGYECLSQLQAHDILKWAAKGVAEEAYARWREKHPRKRDT